MCSSPKVPEQKIPAPQPRLMDEGVSRARQDEQRRLRMLRGRRSTILTGNTGLSPATTTGTLLGGG
jgi:hypothetical protein